jgi:predicted RNA-binding protein with PUA-like domain
VDPTQFDPNDEHYDPDSLPGDPRWFQVDVRALRALPHPVTLERIKRAPELKDMLLIRRGMRLSVQPVTRGQYEEIVRLGKSPS